MPSSQAGQLESISYDKTKQERLRQVFSFHDDSISIDFSESAKSLAGGVRIDLMGESRRKLLASSSPDPVTVEHDFRE